MPGLCRALAHKAQPCHVTRMLHSCNNIYLVHIIIHFYLAAV